MDFFLSQDPNITRLPPEETRILSLCADPYPDGRRLRVTIELTPFQQRPNLELALAGPDGEPSGSASIVEPVGWTLELTMHIRNPRPGRYTLHGSLVFPASEGGDERQVAFELPPG
ncbi:MAG: hypothetical protein FJZ96_07955 [Chloroflexi bacterium]|nr:hypothetical protein [Chloroflexota bacterium]